MCGSLMITMWCELVFTGHHSFWVYMCVHLYTVLPNHNARVHNYHCICRLSPLMNVSFTLKIHICCHQCQGRNLMWCCLPCLLCLGDITSNLFSGPRQLKDPAVQCSGARGIEGWWRCPCSGWGLHHRSQRVITWPRAVVLEELFCKVQ